MGFTSGNATVILTKHKFPHSQNLARIPIDWPPPKRKTHLQRYKEDETVISQSAKQTKHRSM